MAIQHVHFEATDYVKSISYVIGQYKHFEQHLIYSHRPLLVLLASGFT